MILSDMLSQRLDHCPEEDENEEAILLPNSLFLNLLNLTLQDRIANAKDYDFDVTNAIAILLEEGPSGIRSDLDDWKIEEKDGKKILFYKGKNYIPKDQDIQQDIFKMFHDHKTAGHPGEPETYNVVQQQFRAMLNRLEVNSVLSTAYHPQMDGTTKRVNQEIEAYLAIYCHSHPETWKKAIPTMEFTHNNWCWPTSNSFWTYARRVTQGTTNYIQKHEIPSNWQQD